MDGLGVFWNIAKVTALLLALVILVPLLMRRAVRPTRGGGYRLQVLESVSCGGNRLICVVRCDGRELVVGVTDAQITVLSEQEAMDLPESNAVNQKAIPFIEQLQRVVRRGGGESTQ